MVNFLSGPCVNFRLEMLRKFVVEEDELSLIPKEETHELFDSFL